MNKGHSTEPLATDKFTAQQLRDWKAYELVRSGGRFNMFDPRARKATGLNAERYSFVLKNYSELREAALARVPKDIEEEKKLLNQFLNSSRCR